jgi:hypothetical protein
VSPRRCLVCGGLIEQPASRGRRRKTCGDAHRKALSRHPLWPPGLIEAEEQVVRLVADGHAPGWLALAALAARWREAT